MKFFKNLIMWILPAAVCVSLCAGSLSAAPVNGQNGSEGGDPPITIGADWSMSGDVPPLFTWNSGVPVFSVDGPFTFESSYRVRVDITDAFMKGDQFNVYDNGILIGTTPSVEISDDSTTGDPAAAFADPTYSNGSFYVEAGSHAITIEIINNYYNGGGGYIRVVQTAPDAPVVSAITGTTVTLETITGAEYKADDGAWQTSPIFTGLFPVTEYTFYARYAATADLPASDVSLGTAAATDKDMPAAPAAPAVSGKTDTTVTLETITGAEYRAGDGAWQAGPVFTGLSPYTEYTFYARLAETETAFASPSSAGTAVFTDKSAQAAPPAPSVSSKTAVSVTLTAISGAEYKAGDGAWQASPVFTGLTANSDNTFYARLAETGTAYASPSSAGTAVHTDSAVAAVVKTGEAANPLQAVPFCLLLGASFSLFAVLAVRRGRRT